MMELSPEDRIHCQNVTTQLLDKTLRDCEELGLGALPHSNLDKKRWKKLQSHPHVSIYADRSANSAWLPVMRREDWEYPVAVTAIGQMSYSLDDMLFALMTSSSATQRLRSFLMDRRPEKNCQLVPIVKPTMESPFQYLAVTRFLCTQNWPFTMFKSPREMMLVLATGETTTANGKRCGYEMAQSIGLRSANSQQNPMPRSQVLQARIFWEQGDGSIVVYSKLIVDAKNRLSDSVKQAMLCKAVLGFWKFVPRVLETKKLWWCVKNKKALIHELRAQSQSQDVEESAGCEAKSMKLQSKTVAKQCEFCETLLCGGSKCRISCQLKMVLSSETGFLEQTLTLCPRCAQFVRCRNSADIARAEIREMERTSYGSAASLTKALSTGEEDSFSSASTESY